VDLFLPIRCLHPPRCRLLQLKTKL
jgi:hypothetical protein